MTAPATALFPSTATLPPGNLAAAGAFGTDGASVQEGPRDLISGIRGRGKLELAVARLRAERFRDKLPRPTTTNQRWAFSSIHEPNVTPTGSVVGELIVDTRAPQIPVEHQEAAELGHTLAGAMEILAESAEGAQKGPISAIRKGPISSKAIDHFLDQVLAKVEKLSLDPASSQVFQAAFFENGWARREVPHHFEEVPFRSGVINFAKVLILFNALQQKDPEFAGHLYHLLVTPSLRNFFTNIADLLVFYNRQVDQALRLNTKESLETVAKLGTAVAAIEEVLKLAQKLVPAELTLFWVQAMGERFGSQPTSKVIGQLRRKIGVAQIRLNQ